MVQLWLLIFYLLLFITMGVETLICRNCISVWPVAPCLPLKSFCLTSSGVCARLQVFGSMRLEKLMLTCLENEQNKCGSYWEDPKTHFRHKLSCCSDSNLCNWKPFIRPWLFAGRGIRQVSLETVALQYRKYFKSPANIVQEENKNNRRILVTKKPTENSAGSNAII